jgi:hypothetical protein
MRGILLGLASLFVYVSSYEVKHLNLNTKQQQPSFGEGQEILVLFVGDNSDISKEKSAVF